MREVFVLGGDISGATQAIAQFERMHSKMHREVKKTRTTAQQIVGEFEKIPRRLIVAGGAAMAFSMTIGQIRASWQQYNALLDQSREKLAGLVDHAKNLLSMLPAGKAAALFPGLPGQVARQRIRPEDIITIQETVLSLMPPEAGYSDALRGEARRAITDVVRARGMPAEGIATMVTKAYTMMPGATPRQWGNMLNTLLTQAGFSGQQLQEMGQQVPKAYQAGVIWDMPPEDLMALITVGTRVVGTPAQAMKGMEMIARQAKISPRLGARIGVGRGEMQDMPLYDLLGRVAASDLSAEEFYRYFKGRVGGRAYAILARWPEVEAMRAEYAGARAARGWMAGEAYEAKRAAVPEIRMRERQLVAQQLSALKKLQPGYVRKATVYDELGLMLEEVTDPTWPGALARNIWKGRYGVLRAFGMAPERAAADVIGRAEQGLDPWGVVMRHPGDWRGSQEALYERQRGRLGLTFEPQVPPADVGQRNINLGTEPLGEE